MSASRNDRHISSQGISSLRDRLSANRPLRNLIALGLVTAAAVVAASVAVIQQEQGVRAHLEPQPVFQGLDTKLDQVSKIIYTLGRGMRGTEDVTLERGADGRWTVAERKNYPANQELVKKVLLGMGEIKAFEPRTARPEWHRNLGLLAPEDLGSAVRIAFFDRQGQRMAAILAGKVPETAVDVKGEGMIYVRRDGETQTWLARGRLPLFQSVQGWLDTDFIGIGRDEIRRVTLWAGTDHPVVIARASKDEHDFVLDNIPQDRTTRGAPIVNGAATAVVDLAFDDVAPAASLNFPETSPRAVIETFDGLKVSIVMTGGGGALWAKVSAEADPSAMPAGADMKAVEARAETLNKRLADWAYKLPQAASGQLTQSMDLLTHEAGLEK